MLTFHYIICDVAKKDKYHVKKLIFIGDKLEKSEEYYMNINQVSSIKNDTLETNYTIINDSKIDIDTFLKNINLFKK